MSAVLQIPWPTPCWLQPGLFPPVLPESTVTVKATCVGVVLTGISPAGIVRHWREVSAPDGSHPGNATFGQLAVVMLDIGVPFTTTEPARKVVPSGIRSTTITPVAVMQPELIKSMV